MAAFKLSVGGRKLTLAECAIVREESKQERAAAEQEGGRKWQVWLDLFNQEVAERQSGPPRSGSRRAAKPAAKLRPYKQHWRASSPALPVTPAEVVDYCERHGSLSDEVVFESADHILTASEAVYPLRGQRLGELAFGMCRGGGGAPGYLPTTHPNVAPPMRPIESPDQR